MMEELSDQNEMVQKAEQFLLQSNLLQKQDPIVIVSGTQPLRGATNMMKMGRIGA
jgi:pyruvate kinase